MVMDLLKNKKKMVILSIVLTLVLFFAFIAIGYFSRDIKKYSYDYSGESANWTAVFTGHSTVEWYHENGILKSRHSEEGTLALTYKGDFNILAASKKISYSFKGGAGSLSSENGFSNGQFKFNAPVYGQLDDTEKLLLKLDEKSESLELKRVK